MTECSDGAVDAASAMACQQLLARHAEAQDCGSADKLGALFTSDGRWIRPGRDAVVGRDAIVAHARTMFEAPLYAGRVVHMITNILFSKDGDGLRSTSYCLAYGASQTGPDGAAEMCPPLSIVRYVNGFREEAHRWKISFHQTEFLFRSPSLA